MSAPIAPQKRKAFRTTSSLIPENPLLRCGLQTACKAGDSFELFYDLVQDENGAERPGELLYAAVTIGGETHGYYRFRTPDGVVDYYDDKGSNSKKFLMRTAGQRCTADLGIRLPAASASAYACGCTRAWTGRHRSARRSWRPATARSRSPGARAATAITCASGTRTAIKQPTAICSGSLRASRKA